MRWSKQQLDEMRETMREIADKYLGPIKTQQEKGGKKDGEHTK